MVCARRQPTGAVWTARDSNLAYTSPLPGTSLGDNHLRSEMVEVATPNGDKPSDLGFIHDIERTDPEVSVRSLSAAEPDRGYEAVKPGQSLVHRSEFGEAQPAPPPPAVRPSLVILSADEARAQRNRKLDKNS